MKKKIRRQNLSILLIPDDNSDPVSLRIRYRTLKFLMVMSVIVVIHIIMGGVFYWKYAIVYTKNRLLNRENIELKEDNKKIYSMYEIVDGFMQYQDRVKTALGVSQGLEASNRRSSDLLSNFPPASDLVPTQNLVTQTEESTKPKLDFLMLTPASSSYHNFAKNIPTYLPVSGFLSTTFRDTDWYSPQKHLGIDIAASKGTPVKAAADGIVLFADWTDNLGNLIIIDHMNGFVTYYGHNQILLKKERSTVKKGEEIALLGTSGKSTAPHLHFEIWHNGVPINPLDYLIVMKNR
jgi:murein DD-endopeptidase MepM/ murein hydrolase activator NlpD